MKKHIIFIATLLAMTLSSCSDWLDVRGENIEKEEKNHISRIIRVIEGLIERIRASITRPEKPLWNDFETGPGGTQISISASEYFSEVDNRI